MHCILDEVDKELLVGPIEKLRPLTSQVFSRHNTQAFRPDDGQGKQKPAPLEPTSSTHKSNKPTKKRKLTKPSQPKKKAPQEAEIPEDVNVQSAPEQGTTETSSQLDAPSHSSKRAKKTSEPSLKTYIKKRSKKDSSKTAEPTIQTTDLPTTQPEHQHSPTQIIEIAQLLSGLSDITSKVAFPTHNLKQGDKLLIKPWMLIHLYLAQEMRKDLGL